MKQSTQQISELVKGASQSQIKSINLEMKNKFLALGTRQLKKYRL